MIKALIQKFSKEKINTLTKFPSILTLHRFGEKGRLSMEFSLDNPEILKNAQASEKIDGTNVRIICYGDEFLIGSREFLLYHSSDLFYDPAMGIVDAIKTLVSKIPNSETLTVIYGELYGGKISANSKNYGSDKLAFRIFDVAIFEDLSILEKSLSEISLWRERETDKGIIYGQNFLERADVLSKFSDFDLVPLVDFDLGDFSHQAILDNLHKFIPKTNVAHSENALMKPEGIILRTADRKNIVKIRYEDYERTLKK
jgi:hypothetical protein